MTAPQSKIAILMCTLNGAKHIDDQMESFYTQTHDNWELWISDDGSTDETLDRARGFEERGKPVHIIEGPKAGFAANFLSLVRNRDIEADYFAWSDQDDIWLPDKLARAATWLGGVKPGVPALYFGRTRIVDKAGKKTVRLSPAYPRPPSFGNALCQNMAGGNTMVMNRMARDILSLGDLPDVPAHDWWAYLLISGVGGRVRFDPTPTLRYRQHDGNVMGENQSLGARLKRFGLLLRGEFVRRNDKIVAALQARRHLLTADNLLILDEFLRARKVANPIARLRHLRASGVRRQSRAHNLVLYAASLIRKYP